jgi:alpha-glucosidase (family GH31 glycosyl hydrolase)
MLSLFSLLPLLLVLARTAATYEVEPAALKPTSYHRWAHEHWVWNHNSMSNQVDVMQLIQDYADHNIRVSAVNIDSTWATQFNNFEPDTSKFTDFEGMVNEIHDKGLKVILWATSFVNEDDPDFEYAVNQKYLVRDARGKAKPLKWWHGKGGLLDYTNPDAVKWWHSMMDNVLKMPKSGDGVDGWKCDASDPYIMEYMLLGGAYGYNDHKYESYHEYSYLYYGDFFNYTREVRGEEGLIMSRPVDCLDRSGKYAGSVCLAQSPPYVMTSGWVGDDDGNMPGLKICADKVIFSAWDNFANYGCDIGGYRGTDGNPTDATKKEYFLRSAQLNAFLPLMENGGGGEHRPWMVVPEDADSITDIYREFVNQHYRISPHLLTIGANALDASVSVITPLAEDTSPKHKPLKDKREYPRPTTYSYLLGQNILVHPVVDSALTDNSTAIVENSVEMTFPPGHWLDWWHPSVDKFAHMGEDTSVVTNNVAIDSYAVYVRKNSVLPLLENFVEEKEEDVVTFTWFAPCSMEKDTAVTSEMREPASKGTGMSATYQITADAQITGSITAHSGSAGISFINVPAPKTFTSTCDSKYGYDQETKTFSAVCKDNSQGVKFTVDFESAI